MCCCSYRPLCVAAVTDPYVLYSQAARHPLLLITGPVGCGKTATLHALANNLGFFVLEWVNPVTAAPQDEGEMVKLGELGVV